MFSEYKLRPIHNMNINFSTHTNFLTKTMEKDNSQLIYYPWLSNLKKKRDLNLKTKSNIFKCCRTSNLMIKFININYLSKTIFLIES